MAGPWEEYGPDNNTSAPWEAYGGTTESKKPAGAIRRMADTGLALAKGVVGVPETAVGILDLTTGGKAGKAVEGAGVRFKDAKDVLTSFQSDEQHAADAEVQQTKGFFPTIGTMARNPSTIANALAETIPTMLGGGALARGAVKSGAIRNPITAGAAGEGLVTAGQSAEQVRQETPTGTLSDKQSAVVAGSGVLTGAINRLSGGIANKLGIADVNTAMASGTLAPAAGQAPKGAIRRIAEGAANEGVLQELPQSMQEQAAQNIALDRPIGEGVAEAGAAGMLVGGLMGGGVNAVSGGPQPVESQPAAEPSQVGVSPSEPPGVSPAPETGGFDPLTAVPDEPVRPAASGALGYNPAAGTMAQFPDGSQAFASEVPPAPTKSQAMGIDPNAGPISAAAAIAVDGGAAEVVQRQQAEQAAAEAAKKPGAKGAGKKPADSTPAADAGNTSTVLVSQPPQEIPLAQADQALEVTSERETPSGASPDAGAAGNGAGPANQPAAGGAAVQAAAAGQPTDALSDEAQAQTGPVHPASQEEAAAGPAAPGQPAAAAGVPTTAEGQQPAAPVDEAAHAAATSPKNDLPEPTDAQKEAGNYRKGALAISGLDISIENPEGSTRSGVDPDGKAWSNTMTGHYGYVKRTTGSDGEQQDVYVKPGTPTDYSGPVFVIDQVDPKTGKHDEFKSMIGYQNALQARQAYQKNYSAGWKGLKSIKAMPWDEFKAWVKSEGTKAPAGPAAPASMPQSPARGISQATSTPASGTEAATSQTAQASSPDGTPATAKSNVLRVGTMPNTADPVTIKNGTLFIGKYEALNFDTGEPIKIADDANPLQIRKALFDNKALGANQKVFGAGAPDAAAAPAETKTKAKPGNALRRAAYDRNPMLTFLATHGLFHDKDKPGSQKSEFSPDKAVMVMGYGPVFRKTGLMPDLLVSRAIEDGYLPADGTEAQLVDLIRRAIGGEKILPMYAEGVADAEMERQMAARAELESEPPQEDNAEVDPWAEEQAVDDVSALSDAGLIAVDDDIPWDASSNVSLESAMRSMGFSEQEIEDAIAEERGRAQESGQGSGVPDEATASQAPRDREQRDAQAGSGAEQEGLTAPTRADVLSQQERADNAPALDEKAQIDREAAAQTLTAQTAPEQRKDTSGDMFAMEKAQATIERRNKGGTQPDGPSLFDAPGASEAPVPIAPAATIEDFGEKLEGAKKDRAPPSLSRELTDDEIAGQPFSQIWPAAEIDSIEDKFAAAVAFAARAEVTAKPRVAYKVKRWVEKVKGVRDLAQVIVRGTITREEFLAKLRENRGLRDFAAKVKLLEAIDRAEWGRIGTVSEAPDAYRYEDGKQIANPMVGLYVDDRHHWLEGSGAIEDHVDAINAMLGKPVAGKPMQFEVRGSGNSFSINKKGDKEYRKLKTFATSKEALAYLREHNADLVAAWEGVKDSDNVRERDVRSKENRPRTAKNYRDGKDVTPELFEQTFGFRGVQFGNWVAQGAERKARQGMLNEAFDALMDLAEIVQVPPKALSLNGTMGLSFGARGSGWASAHFEPSNLVINLTKTRGAGTFAHEWFHALDNYFSRQRGGEVAIERGMNAQRAYRTRNFITYRPEPMMVHKTKTSTPISKVELTRRHKANPSSVYYDPENWQVDPGHPQGVRPEVEAAFADLVSALNASPMAARSRSIDKAADGYWSQIIERGARSFENYVISKMMQNGFHNDYLANVTPVQDFPRSKDRYPYLLPEEVAPIAEAFDALFDTLQTKEDDAGNVAIFEPDAPYETDIFGDPLPQSQRSAGTARPAGPWVRGNIQPAAGVQDTPAPAGEYYARTFVGSEASRELGASRITRPEHAAQATQYLYKSAVERLDGIVTDKNGKPLAVVGGFKGALSQASVYPATIVAEAVRVPGAAKIWLSHNHPSGSPILSSADERLNGTMADVFRGSGIEPMGLLAVGNGEFGYVDASGMVTRRSQTPPASASIKVPVIERQLSPGGVAGVKVDSPTIAKDVARDLYSKAKKPGLALLNSQNELIAWVPISEAMMGELRGTGQLNAIYRAISESNAGAAIIVHGGELGYQSVPKDFPRVTPSENIAAALQKIDVRVLDLIDATTGVSAAERGKTIAVGPVYARSPYYSALTRQVGKINAKAQSGGGWALNIQGLVKAGKVKQDEVHWTGVMDWLRLQEGKVSKDQVVQFLDQNGVKVEEVVLGMGAGVDVKGLQEWMAESEDPDEMNPAERRRVNDLMDRAARADAQAIGELEGLGVPAELLQGAYDPDGRVDGVPRYGQYQLPGGTNYREVLLTLPKRPGRYEVRKAEGKWRIWNNEADDWARRSDGKILTGYDTEQAARSGMSVMGGSEANNFRSNHWDQPNVLAHIRVNDRTDTDGRKVLFVEEIQSDWGQQGKKHGFRNPKTRETQLAHNANVQALGDAILDLASDGGIPSAPFVGKTDAWLSLALKRIVKMAADGGYDRVAFINGEQSAERYDLSKRVKQVKVEWARAERDTVSLKAYDFNDNTIVREYDIPRTSIENYIGKDLAQRADEHLKEYGKADLRGMDLKIGGEGMKAFYDKILPNTLKDVLKKLGGGTLDRFNPGARTANEIGDFLASVGRPQPASESEGGNIAFNLSDSILAKASEDLPQFSRESGRGVPMADAKAIVAAVREALPTAPPIHILESIDKAPDELRADIERAGAERDVDAAFHNGEIYVFPGNIGSVERMMFVVAHHEIRHFGLRSMLGPKAGPTFLAIHATNPKVRAAAAEQVRKGYAKSRVLAVEEALADMPVEELVALNGFDKIIAAVRSWLRSVASNLRRRGLVGLADAIEPMTWTDKDVASLIARAEGVSRGGSARYRTSETVFARTGGFASAQALAEVTNTLREATRPIGTVSWWDKSVGTQYHKSTKDADFKRVFDGYVQQTDDTAHYAIESERNAPDILRRLESIPDAFRGVLHSGAKHKADLVAVSRALFANIEGEEGIKQIRYDDQSLRQIFNLTPKQIEMYHQARAAVDTSVARLAQTYAAQMGQSNGMDIERVKNMDLDDTIALVKEFIQDTHDEARAVEKMRKEVAIEDEDPAMDETQALEKEYGTKPPKAPTLEMTAQLLARLDAMADHAKFLQESAYMPALRFGQFAVTVTQDDETLHFEMFESQMAAYLAAMKLRRQYPRASVAKSVMNPEQYAMFKGVSPETVELFAKFTGADQNEAFQNYIALAKSARSVKMRELKRKGIAGFSDDATRVLAAFLTSNARQSAINMNIGKITDALASKDLARKGDVQREAQKLHEYMANPIEEARRLRSFMFMHFMGGSIASALVNLTQPVMQTTPYLHQWAGSKSAGIMLASAKMAATGKIADQQLRDAVQRAAVDGITEPHEIHQLMADASGSSFGGNLRARAAVKLWGSFFSTAESYNRRITFIAAYQVALQTKQRDPYEFARKAVIETQGLYAKVNRPNWARGAVGATIFTFKQFSIAYLEWFTRLPPKQKMLAVAILLIAAGADGLPFAEDLQDLIDTVGQSLGYNTNSKKWQRKILAQTFGDDLGEILNTGLLSKSAVDVQGRLGMGNLIPGTELFKPSETDKTRSATELAGPISGVLTAFQKALAKAQRGEIVGMTGAIHELAPVAVKNLLKGIDMAKTGVYKDTRGYKVADVDVVDSFVKMLGLQPSNIARNTRKFVDEMQDKGMVTMMEAMIADRWAQGVAQKDPDQVAKARQALIAWNENNPDSRIVIKPAQILRRVREMDKTRSERFVKTVPKELRAGVVEKLR